MTQPDARDVLELRMRPYGSADRERLVRMSDTLSAQSLYSRFFSGTPHLPELYIQHMQRMDHWDHDALIAMLDDEIVGIAEYVRDRDDPARADIAVLVADSWQRHGVARCLVGLLAELARRRGISEFNADVLPSNSAALTAIRQSWPAARSQPADPAGAARFRLPLSHRTDIRSSSGAR